jgi:divalent metal cation (Fe/Co/Zn/Cd) transporter
MTMKKGIALLIAGCLLFVFAAGGLFAQADTHTQTGGTQDKPMTKQQLAAEVANAHYLANLYAYRYSRSGGKEKERKAYEYWLDRRQMLLKQYNEARD